VAQRPLSCVQYPVLYLSRLQRICSFPWYLKLRFGVRLVTAVCFYPATFPSEAEAPDETPSVRHHLMIVGLTLVMVIPKVSVCRPTPEEIGCCQTPKGQPEWPIRIRDEYPPSLSVRKAEVRWRTERRHRKETRLFVCCVFCLCVCETLSALVPATTTSHHAQGDRGYPAFPRRSGWRGGKALNVEGSPHVQFGFGLRGVQPSSEAHGSVSASDVSINWNDQLCDPTVPLVLSWIAVAAIDKRISARVVLPNSKTVGKTDSGQPCNRQGNCFPHPRQSWFGADFTRFSRRKKHRPCVCLVVFL